MYLSLVVILFLGIWLTLYLLLQLFACMDAFLKEVSEVHFDQHTSLPTVLSVTIANCKEVLMESLANVRS